MTVPPRKTDDFSTIGEDSVQEHDPDFQAKLEKLAKENEGRPLVLVTAGKAGAGKSTLINNFLGLKGKERAKTSRGATAGTETVQEYKGIINGVPVTVIDTPGFEDQKSHDKQALAGISQAECGEASLLFYCLSMNVGERVGEADVRIIKKITKAYTPEIWKHTVLVLTFADMVCEDDDDDDGDEDKRDYKTVVKEYVKHFQIALNDTGIAIDVCSMLTAEEVVDLEFDGIVAIPVGKHPKKSLPNGEIWPPMLLTVVLRKSDAKDIPAIMKVSGFQDLVAGIATFVGAQILAMCGNPEMVAARRETGKLLIQSGIKKIINRKVTEKEKKD